MAIDTPHFTFPFRLRANGQAAEITEQDSEREIEDCMVVLLQTEIGSRIELPDYGVPDLPFRERGTDLAALALIIEEWEGRADFSITQTEFADLTERIRIALGEADLG